MIFLDLENFIFVREFFGFCLIFLYNLIKLKREIKQKYLLIGFFLNLKYYIRAVQRAQPHALTPT